MDIDFIRNKFPSLGGDFIYMDNAGGSQILGSVIQQISDHLIHRNVQLGASYEVSKNAGNRLDGVHKRIANFINANHVNEVVIGSSSTMLLRILSLCIREQWEIGDEIIVTNSDHEANVSCWVDLGKSGITVKIWQINKESLEFDIADLQNLISEKTRLVAMVHTSNILGTINPIKKISEIVHHAGALLCVDGVAFAPHRRVDVQELGIDFYVFSWYKVYGPHLAVLWGRLDLLKELESINHYFIGKAEVPYKLQPGNVNYELTAGLVGIMDYLIELSQHHGGGGDSNHSESYDHAFSLIADHEQNLTAHFLGFINSKNALKIIGSTSTTKDKRVPTISFVHDSLKSSSIVEMVDLYRIGIRFGDFYAKKLIQSLGLEEKDGVIRVSMVHYNSIEEVDQLISVLDRIMPS